MKTRIDDHYSTSITVYKAPLDRIRLIIIQVFVFFYFLLQFSNLNAQIIINEIMFNPAGNENQNEFIELYNMGVNAVDLNGWSISDSSSSDFIIDKGDGTILQPGNYALILDPDYFANSTHYDSLITSAALVLTIDGSTFGYRGLSNSIPEPIFIISAEDDTIASYRYSIDNDDGFSDEKIIPDTADALDNWGNSLSLHGTPGARNSITPYDFDTGITVLQAEPLSPLIEQTIRFTVTIHNLGIYPPATSALAFFLDSDKDGELSQDEVLNEITVDVALISGYRDSMVAGFDWQPPFAGYVTIWAVITSAPDSNIENNILSHSLSILEAENQIIISEIMYQPTSNAPEWIEIYNRGKSEVNMLNWSIRDKTQAKAAVISRKNSLLPPAEYIVLTGDSASMMNFYGFPMGIISIEEFPKLNNTGDEITLFDPSGRISDFVAYSSTWGNNPGISLERINYSASSNTQSNWGLSTATEGATPGKVNSLHSSGKVEQLTILPDPNPFSPGRRSEVCTITVEQPLTQSLVTMKIFDRYGRLVRDLLRGEPKGSSFSMTWDGKNDSGRLMPTGIYVILFNAISTNSGQSIEHKTTVVLVNEYR